MNNLFFQKESIRKEEEVVIELEEIEEKVGIIVIVFIILSHSLIQYQVRLQSGNIVKLQSRTNGMYLTIQDGKDIVCNSNSEKACEL